MTQMSRRPIAGHIISLACRLALTVSSKNVGAPCDGSAMARGGGAAQAGVVYHLISRFVAKEWFIESEVERRVYLSLLGTALKSTDWTCFSFAVMSSHIHLGLVAGRDRLAAWLRPMHTVYANWLNVRRERIGAVFVKGPNFITVPPDQYARLVTYIHYNPVRAGVVAYPEDSDWTSHRAYVGRSRVPGWLAVEAGLALCGFASGADFQRWAACTPVSRDSLIASGAMPKIGRGRPADARLDPNRSSMCVDQRSKNDRCWKRSPSRICSTRLSDSDPIRSPSRVFSTWAPPVTPDPSSEP